MDYSGLYQLVYYNMVIIYYILSIIIMYSVSNHRLIV